MQLTDNNLKNKILLLLLAISLVNGALWATMVPKWEVDDEPAYWADVKVMAGEKINDYKGYAPTGHPKLFPLLASPLYLATRSLDEDIQVLLVRFLSVLLATGVVFLGFKISQKILPQSDFVQLAVPISLTFMPQFRYIMSSVNSDVLLNFVFALFLYQLINFMYQKPDSKKILIFLVTLIAGIFAKERFMVALPVLFSVLIFYILFRYRASIMKIFGPLTPAKVIIPIVLLVIIFSAISPIFAQKAQERFGRMAAALFKLEKAPVRRSTDATFVDWVLVREFWGYFGWIKVPLSNQIYDFLFLLTRLSFLGLIILLARNLLAAIRIPSAQNPPKPPFIKGGRGGIQSPFTKGGNEKNLALKFNLPPLSEVGPNLLAIFTLFTTLFFASYATAAYDVYGSGALGRYMFIAVVPFFFFFSWGIEQLIPSRLRKFGLVLFFLGFLFLNLLSLIVYIATYFY